MTRVFKHKWIILILNFLKGLLGLIFSSNTNFPQLYPYEPHQRS